MLGQTAYFDIALASVALLKIFGKVASPPIKFLPALWRIWNLPFVLNFYKVYINTLDICFFWIPSRVQSGHLLEGSALILRVVFSFDASDIFGGGSKVVGEFSHCSHVRWIESHPTYLGVSAIVAGYGIIGDLRFCFRCRAFNLTTAHLAALLTGS